MDAARGHPLRTTSTGRTRAEQWEAWRKYLNGGPLAAYPGTSPHEFGNAIDTNERLVGILARHGWSRPLPSEPWHFVYNPNSDRHRFDPTPAGEEDMALALSEDDKAWMRLMVQQEVAGALGLTEDDKAWMRLMVQQELERDAE